MKTLQQAIIDLDVNEVEANLSIGINPNEELFNEQFPLAFAIENFFCQKKLINDEFISVIKLLLNAGANVNQLLPDGQYPLHLAMQPIFKFDDMVDEKFLYLIELLLETDADPNVTIASDKGNNFNRTTILEKLLYSYIHLYPSSSLFFNYKEEKQGNLQQRKEFLYQLIKLLINYKAALNRVEKTQFWYEFVKDSDIANLLLDKGIIHIGLKDDYGRNLLHIACKNNNIDIVKRLIDLGIDINAVDKHGKTALDYCLDNGFKSKMVFILLTYKAKSSIKTSDIHFFILAEKENHEELQKLLLKRGVATLADENGLTALHYVQTVQSAELLLAYGANLEATLQANPYTPLSSAIYRNNEKVASYLMVKGAHNKIINANDQTLWHLAALSMGSLSLIHLFPQDLINHQDQRGQTALHLACQREKIEYIFELLERGAKIDVIDREGLAAFEYLGFRNFESKILELGEKDKSRCQELLSKLWFPIPNKLPHHWQMIYRIARRCEFQPIVDAIFKNLKPESLSLTERQTLWQNAIIDNDFFPLNWWVEQGQKFEDNSLFSLITTSIQLRHIPILKFILEHSVLPIEGSQLGSIFYDLCNTYERISSQEEIQVANQLASLLLPYFLRQPNQQFLDDLNNFAKIEISNAAWFLIRKIILEYPQYLKIENHSYLVEKSFWNQDRDILIYLITSFDSEVNAKNLSLAAKCAIDFNHLDFLILLCEYGLHPDQVIFLENHGSNLKLNLLEYVFYVANHYRNNNFERENMEKLAIELIHRGANVYFISSELPSSFHQAVMYDWVEVVKILLEPPYHYSANLSLAQLNGQELPIEMALDNKSEAMLELLLSHQANIDLTKYNKYPLFEAFEVGFFINIKKLIEYGADINLKSYDRLFDREISFLSKVLISEKNPDYTDEIVNLLLNKGAHVTMDEVYWAITMQNINFKNLKELIIRCKKEELINHKMLHYSINENNQMAVSILLDLYGPEMIHARDARGRNVLHCAAKLRNKELFDILLSKGANINGIDFNEETVRFTAIYHDTADLLGFEFGRGIDREQFDRLNRLLLHRKEFNNTNVDLEIILPSIRGYSIKLLTLLGTIDAVQRYIETYADKNAKQPIHDLCLFHCPYEGSWAKDIWSHLALQHGPQLTHYFHFAPKIEGLLGRPPQNVEEIISTAKQIKYQRENENINLASLFHYYQISENAFNRVLDCYPIKLQDRLPPLEIPGHILSFDQRNEKLKNYVFEKLPSNDLRGFILGALTNCCQSVGSAGEGCAAHGMTSPWGGFYILRRVIDEKEIKKWTFLIEAANGSSTFGEFLSKLKEKEQRKKYIKWKDGLSIHTDDAIKSALLTEFNQELEKVNQPQIVAQTWAWISQEGHLVLDSWERRHIGDDDLCEPFLLAAAKQAITCYGFHKVFLGQGGNTPQHLNFPSVTPTQRPKDYFAYRDSLEQFMIADRDELEVHTAEQLIATSMASLFDTHQVEEHDHISFYTDEVMHQLAQYYLSINPKMNLKILPPIDAHEIGSAIFSDTVVDQINQSSAHYFLQLIRRLDRHWCCIIFSKLRPTTFYGDQVPIYYLDATADLSEVLTHQYLQNVLKLSPYDYKIIKNQAIFSEDIEHSAAWLIEMIHYFIWTHQIIAAPISFADVMDQHQTILQPLESAALNQSSLTLT